MKWNPTAARFNNARLSVIELSAQSPTSSGLTFGGHVGWMHFGSAVDAGWCGGIVQPRTKAGGVYRVAALSIAETYGARIGELLITHRACVPNVCPLRHQHNNCPALFV